MIKVHRRVDECGVILLVFDAFVSSFMIFVAHGCWDNIHISSGHFVVVVLEGTRAA
jgi:hypothetical protein